MTKQLTIIECVNPILRAFWHRFALTEHSDIGINPSKYKIEKIENDPNQFARNDMAFIDPTGCDHEKFSEGFAHFALQFYARCWFRDECV